MNSTTSLVAFLGKHAFPVETRSFFRRALLIALGAAFSYCALAAEAKADIRFVQGNYAVPQTPTSPLQVTFTNAQTAGNLIRMRRRPGISILWSWDGMTRVQR
jgi:hypothetical protein